MRAKLLLPLLLLLSSCAALGPTADEVALLRSAHDKLAFAKAQSDEVRLKGMKTFRDELVRRALAEIDQASYDDLANASKDGLEEAEADEIAKRASERRLAAIDTYNKGYDAVVEHQAGVDFNEIFTFIQAYWLTRLDSDAQKAEIVKLVSKLKGGE